MKDIKEPKSLVPKNNAIEKPLPLRPKDTLAVDETSKSHLLNLINSWLNDINIPQKPWSDVLLRIALSLLERSLDSSDSNRMGQIWIQTLDVHSPKDSKFLPNVFYGDLLQNDGHELNFPLGGTVRIYGVVNDMNTERFLRLVHTLVYVVYCLYLETHVMRDSHVKSVPARSTTSHEIDLELSPPSPPPLQHLETAAKPSSPGWFGWLKKFVPNQSQQQQQQSSIATATNTSENSRKKKRKSNPLNAVSEGIRRGISLNNLNKQTLQASTDPLVNSNIDVIEDNDPHRFFKIKRRIDNALISSSPQCHFPHPTLLDRLEVEENILLEQKQVAALYKDTVSYASAPSFVQKQRPSLKSQARQSSSFKRSSFLKRSSSAAAAAAADLPQSVTAYSSVRTQGLMADSRIGLEHLILDTRSLDGFLKQQNITIAFSCYPIGCPNRPCLGPMMSKIDFFQYKSPEGATSLFPNIDQSLGHTIRHWSAQSQLLCQAHIEEQVRFVPSLSSETPTIPSASDSNNSRPDTPGLRHSESSVLTLASPYLLSRTPSTTHRQCSKFHGCHQPLVDHIFSFSHGVGRVNVYTDAEQTCTTDNKDIITTWLCCSVCDVATEPMTLSERAASFSFAKYLELILYSSKLASPESFCEHTAKGKADNARSRAASITRCFLHHGILFKFMYEEANYYELRAPRIQLALETLESDRLTFDAPRMCLSTLSEWKHTSAEQDVDLFFQSVRAHLDLLNHYTIAESRRKIRSALVDPKQHQIEHRALDTEIKALRKRLDADHSAMLKVLSDTNINELNDFRRYFGIQSKTIISYLTTWQNSQCKEVDDVCRWDSPDYISLASVHCFPGSSVLVREDEPTSIIAYTLSSNDYIQEVLNDKEKGEEFADASSSSKNPSIPSLTSTDTTETSSKGASEGHSTTVAETTAQGADTKKHTSLMPSILDGYYSSIERKYVSPSTGATSETASFRTMITEVVKSSVLEASISNSKRLDELKARLSPWTKKQEETKLKQSSQDDLKRDLTERTLKPLLAVQQEDETKEVKVASYFHEDSAGNSNKNLVISPHIKHKFVHEGIEFTCIVYYAKEFELLRRQCNINQLMIESLCRCQTWTANGGKSKSHFYKTQDDRFVIKEMMNAWNVAEKDAFLKFAPKYFEHIKKSANEPSILAKIFGFFTIRMKSVVDKKSILNLDVLVMEHLFFNQAIVKKFDFKGIQDRHVEEFRKQQQDATLWDGDWLNEYRTQLPVHEQSKAMMELAIDNDTDFLSKCNIMDYSLLVGIDQQNHQMTVGIVGMLTRQLVDFIGAYTWYKKIESKSKSTLQPRKEVTVVPPEQYRARFLREVYDYFVPVPGKFDLVAPTKTLPSLLI